MNIQQVSMYIVTISTILSLLLTLLPPTWTVSKVLSAVVVDVRALIAALSPPVTPPSAKPPTPPTLLLLLLLVGCAGNFETLRTAKLPVADPSAYCQGVASDESLFGGIAKGLAALGGASGLSTIPVNDQGGRIALALTTGAAAAGGLVFAYMSDQKASTWATNCAPPVNPMPAPSASVSR